MSRPVLVDSVTAAHWLNRSYGLDLKPVTIRQWGHRGYIRVRKSGKYRYDLREIEAHARFRGLTET